MGLFKRRPPQGRRGLILGRGEVQFEVREVERQGQMSRVEIIRTSGTLYPLNAADELRAWQLTDTVAWFPESDA